MIEQTTRSSFAAAASAVNDRREEINKLNVFPVPDGDTGTNMALTLGSVVRELDELPPDATMAKVAEAVRHGSLMGARGNSGVITSQILRGLAEGLAEVDGPVETPQVAAAFRRAVEVAFRAVKKPVEGTIDVYKRQLQITLRSMRSLCSTAVCRIAATVASSSRCGSSPRSSRLVFTALK